MELATSVAERHSVLLIHCYPCLNSARGLYRSIKLFKKYPPIFRDLVKSLEISGI